MKNDTLLFSLQLIRFSFSLEGWENVLFEFGSEGIYNQYFFLQIVAQQCCVVSCTGDVARVTR